MGLVRLSMNYKWLLARLVDIAHAQTQQ